MRRAVAAAGRVRIETEAAVLVAHRPTQSNTFDRRHGALRGTVDRLMELGQQWSSKIGRSFPRVPPVNFAPAPALEIIGSLLCPPHVA